MYTQPPQAVFGLFISLLREPQLVVSLYRYVTKSMPIQPEIRQALEANEYKIFLSEDMRSYLTELFNRQDIKQSIKNMEKAMLEEENQAAESSSAASQGMSRIG